MGANDWSICPQCHKNRGKKKVRYGKVSETDYVAFLNKKAEPEEETMREDYEISVDENGLFTVSYGCFCETCGFKYSFSHKEHLMIHSKTGKKKET